MAVSKVLLRLTQTEFALARRAVREGKVLSVADALRRGAMLFFAQNGMTDAERAAIASERNTHRPIARTLQPWSGDTPTDQGGQGKRARQPARRRKSHAVSAADAGG